ncbi:hypothetical protein ACOI1H_08145 [Loktanella sp. DJP18]|uniref:hypothetical protein n=1 Tax=Loktanella sp. DJP18 TaxID=3409788 RepID=UPI003BB685C8
MTQFLNPALASSKAARKERKQIALPVESSATERAVVTLQRALGRDFKRSDNKDRVIKKAINDTMDDFIAALNEDALDAFFFSLERVATPANRRRIAQHALRTEIVDEMHIEADEEDALAAEEQEGAEAKIAFETKAAAEGKSAKATPKEQAAADASGS